tara:strand:+ start:7 stop:183 length:177 start_codon:yes stop_codon:yes gene_type:complete
MMRRTMVKKLFIPPRLDDDEVDILIDLIKKIDIGTLSQRQYMQEVDKIYKQIMEDRND